jgi:phage shock protein A
MASLLTGIKNWFREKKDNAAEALADPARDRKYEAEDAEEAGRKAIAAAKKQEIEFRQKVRDVVADLHQMEKDLASKKAEYKKYDDLAKKFAKAVKGGDTSTKTRQNLDSAANEAARLEAEVNTTKEALKGLQKSRDELQVELDRVRNKIAKAEQKFAVNAARIKASVIKTTLAESKARIAQGGKGLSALDEMDKTADRLEAVSDATEDMAEPASSIEDLEAEAAALGGGSSAADKYLS